MRAPPNIHELDNLILLRQALEILEADESTQRALYPPERDAAEEMGRLYRDAWARVRPVFWPILADTARRPLDAIERSLTSAPPDWSAIRIDARVALEALPRSGSRGTPRAWLDQIVAGPNHLMLRRQQLASDEALD